jgi:glycosyltransferase involved in cell wall biosynthesis
VCKALTASGVRFRGHIAGPFESEAIRRQVCSELEHLPDLKLWGAAYGETKAEFFRSIDVLLFPSHYRNEAEPVTILEALSQAVCVMATDLGCIGNLLEHAREEWIFPEAGFVERACERLARYSTNPASLAAARLQARARFEFLHDASAAQLRKLIDGMLAA